MKAKQAHAAEQAPIDDLESDDVRSATDEARDDQSDAAEARDDDAPLDEAEESASYADEADDDSEAMQSDDELDDELDDEEIPVRRARLGVPSRRALTPIIAALVATLAVVSMLIYQVWSRHRLLAMGYEVSELIGEREAELEAQRRLHIELRMVTRSDRLEPVARDQLGLVSAAPEQILYLQLPSSEAPPAPDPQVAALNPAQP